LPTLAPIKPERVLRRWRQAEGDYQGGQRGRRFSQNGGLIREEGDDQMTPEERNLVIELFDRLATLEDAQRDPEAERLIRDGLRQAPNAPYALVQTVLVQDEALKRADARIRELEGAVP
jgi:Uncharacterized protein conserved in bacteria (DUF2076)